MGARPGTVPGAWGSRARSVLKLRLTLRRSSGCVQQAAPQEASPPKYQRDARASAMARAGATWPDPGQHHNSGSSLLTPGSKCHRAPAPGAANAPARPQGRGLADSTRDRTRALGGSARSLKAVAARGRDRGSAADDRETPGARPYPPPLSRLWLGSQIRSWSATVHPSGGWFPTSPPALV